MHSVPLRLRQTTIGILQERALRESGVARAQLQHALNSRVLIEQSKRVAAYTHNSDLEQAFAVLSSYARNDGLPLVEVAESVVNRILAL